MDSGLGFCVSHFYKMKIFYCFHFIFQHFEEKHGDYFSFKNIIVHGAPDRFMFISVLYYHKHIVAPLLVKIEVQIFAFLF
jgi:hypothetical protein